jgi:tetratricopeptide (TPR) repeat protein
MSTQVAFLSYSHDSDAHRERVLGLSERLRADGVTTILDRYVAKGSPPEGWPRWMLNGLNSATHILCVCTETYHRRFLGQEVPGQGKGADWEGALLTQARYDARSHTNKFIPILFAPTDEAHIPEPLRGQTYYLLTSEASYQALYDALLDQAGVEPGAIGEPKCKPRATGQPLSFGDPVSSARANCPADLSRILKYAPAELIGRESVLSVAWEQVRQATTPRPHVLTFVALGGEGKTSLVAKWAAELAAQDWPGCDAAFAWSFYSQGTREQLAASSDLFLKAALTFFGDDADQAFAASPAGAFEKGQRLARLVGQRRSLLILDGLEPLQYAPTAPTPGELKDQGVAALLKGLATASHGLCIVTTRYSLPDLKAFWQTTAPEVKLLRLSRDAGVHLLKTLGVTGTAQEFATLVEDVKGHALTLTLLGGFLKRAFHGDIRQRDHVKFEKADEKMDGGHAFRTMAAYEQWLLRDGDDEGRREVAVLRLMGLFDRPADAGCLAALLQPPVIPGLTEQLVGLAEDDWEFCLTGLESAKLVTLNRDDSANPKSAIQNPKSLDAHPHLREYFARQLRTQQPDAWRAAHWRLYEHLCASTPDKPQPTLEDLQPLYQAVAHGCQAGLQQEASDKVYSQRILRVNENYSVKKLGALGTDLGAVACFFETPWSRVSPALTEADQALLLNDAAFRLRALGRLTESLEPMRAGLQNYLKQEHWAYSARLASNLSELELTLGEVAGAVGDAEQSVTYADRSGDAFMRKTNTARLADALHQSGRRAEAETRFREAEQMQKERQPDYPQLYTVSGFQYCDLLLAAPERAAWQRVFESRASVLECASPLALSGGMAGSEESSASEGKSGGGPPHSKTLRAVRERAAQTLKWISDYGRDVLSPSLDHLTLGRVALYAAILESCRSRREEAQTSAADRQSLLTSAPTVAPARRELDAAVADLRRAGTQHMIPLALLTRAWLRSLTGSRTGPESAQSDLDEAWEIAERGPMPIFRIRLTGDRLSLRADRDRMSGWAGAEGNLEAYWTGKR